MNQAKKGYEIFLPASGKLVQCVLYIVYPLMGVFLSFILLKLSMFPFVNVLISSIFLIVMEVGIDYFSFHSIQSKRVNYLEYIKTSAKGENLVMQAVRFNEFRRAATMIVTIIGCYFIATLNSNKNHAMSLGEAVVAVLLAIIFTEIAVICIRFTASLVLFFAILYFILTLYATAYILGITYMNTYLFMSVLCLIYCLLLGLIQKLAKNGVGGSYYDE